MKIIKINDNLKINVEIIYSLEKHTNKSEIDEWTNEYNNNLNLFAEDPPLLAIEENRLFKPEYGKVNNENDLELYKYALNNYILELIGNKPEYVEKYIVILNTGLKINVDKNIYDKINNYLEKYIDKEM